MTGRIVVMQHKYRFIPIGVGLAYAPGQRGIVVYVAGYAFAECVLGPSVCTADIPESSVALFLQEIGCPRTAEPSASLPDLYTAVGVDAVPFFRIYAGFYIWSLNVNPHPSGVLRVCSGLLACQQITESISPGDNISLALVFRKASRNTFNLPFFLGIFNLSFPVHSTTEPFFI